VFAYARRGIPFGVPAFAWRLRACDTPAVLLAHEFAYPWRQRGWRGTAHALTQRVALVPLVAASAACIATTDKNARYLRSRRWLPRRRVGVAPVFSNISPGAATAGEVAGRVGVFGFGTGGPAVPLTVGAVARAAETVGQAHLVLIGSPGPDGPVADEWRAAARDTGCRLHFTGVGTVGEISAHLRAVQVVILADDGGPSSRKGSLAAALAHGKPVVAFDGPETWPDLAASGAVELVPLDVEQAAARVTSLLTDRERRTSLGRAALEFSRSELAPERIAAAIGRLVIEVADVGGAPRPPVMEGRHG
jgi:glycosyltransferase involved in cell wall biosynthesis